MKWFEVTPNRVCLGDDTIRTFPLKVITFEVDAEQVFLAGEHARKEYEIFKKILAGYDTGYSLDGVTLTHYGFMVSYRNEWLKDSILIDLNIQKDLRIDLEIDRGNGKTPDTYCIDCPPSEKYDKYLNPRIRWWRDGRKRTVEFETKNTSMRLLTKNGRDAKLEPLQVCAVTVLFLVGGGKLFLVTDIRDKKGVLKGQKRRRYASYHLLFCYRI